MSKIEMKNVSFAYDGQANLFENVSQVLDTSWHLGLVGRNGRGKTTLFKLIQNQLAYQGTLICDVNVQYFPQVVAHPNQTVRTMLEQAVAPEHLWEVEREMQLLGLNVDRIETQIYQTLSGGEQTKVYWHSFLQMWMILFYWMNQQTIWMRKRVDRSHNIYAKNKALLW
ncbi:putative ATPase RIL [Weissella viridescens]|uniref:Putative ATPase RIL n=1 Tax=Weissella viridescens TaxID=1629 RepID=A0A380P1Q5_WEIVI|nr:putative ATPase RIL [Weissella viridescens]